MKIEAKCSNTDRRTFFVENTGKRKGNENESDNEPTNQREKTNRCQLIKKTKEKLIPPVPNLGSDRAIENKSLVHKHDFMHTEAGYGYRNAEEET